jgi:N-acyl-D-amino-acid deacylase
MTQMAIELQNARLLDGTGRDPRRAHVLVANGRIQRVGDDPAGAGRTLDLEGSFLAPGFIDMHSHSELRLFETPTAPEKLTQGITTEVLGQDGVSVAPVPSAEKSEWAGRVKSLDGQLDREWPWTGVREYLDELRTARPAVNTAYYAPHGNLRSTVASFEDRELTDSELSELKAQLRRAITEGAFGMSKGMIYPPSSYARDDELLSLATVLSEYDSFMVSHVWNETDHVVESIRRYVDICQRGGCQAHVSHLKVGGRENWGKSRRLLELFDAMEISGQRITFDQYPYTAGSTMLTALLPPWARQGNSEDIVDRLRDEETVSDIAADIAYQRVDPATEETIPRAEWENLAHAAGDWNSILITDTESGKYQGKTIADIASERDLEPVEAVCTLLVEESLNVTMVDFIMSNDDIRRFIGDERGTFCTDGVFGGNPHPRTTGTFAKILAEYVRDRPTLTPELFAYKAAGRAADILGLPDRGYVREGYVADLVVFDLPAVSSNSTYDRPLLLSDGFEYVFVGGTIAVEDGEITGKRNGSVLRSHEEWDGETRPILHRSPVVEAPVQGELS